MNFQKNSAVVKIGYDEIGIKQPTNVIRNSEVVDLRYSPRRVKPLSLLQVVSQTVTLEKLPERFWTKQDSA